MNDIEQIREKLKGKYASPKWIKRVDGMADTQVIAIYKRLQKQYKI